VLFRRDATALLENQAAEIQSSCHRRRKIRRWRSLGLRSGGRTATMSPLGLILVIILIVALLGGFSGRFGGYGYGYGHGGISVLGVILIILVILLVTGRI
jgi:hypothetical protein